MDYVISPDGTCIAFDRLGSGPAVLLIGAGPTDRRSEAPLADLLAEHFVGVEDLQAKMDAAQAPWRHDGHAADGCSGRPVDRDVRRPRRQPHRADEKAVVQAATRHHVPVLASGIQH